MRLDDVLTVLDALERAGVRDAVFGGLAMAAHGFDRATRGLDLFVAPDAANDARLRRALAEVFDDPDIATITAEDLGGAYPAVQYGPPDVDDTIHIVSRLGDAFRFEDLEVQRVPTGPVTITVVTPTCPNPPAPRRRSKGSRPCARPRSSRGPSALGDRRRAASGASDPSRTPMRTGIGGNRGTSTTTRPSDRLPERDPDAAHGRLSLRPEALTAAAAKADRGLRWQGNDDGASERAVVAIGPDQLS